MPRSYEDPTVNLSDTRTGNDKACRKLPLNLEKMFNDAAAAFQSGELGRAEKLLKKIDSVVPQQHPVLHLRGLVALKGRKSAHAIKYLKAAAAIQPSPDILTALGSAHKQAGAFDEAIAVLGQALDAQPGNPDIAYNLGNALKAVGRLEDSVTHYEASVGLDPGFSDAWYNLGLALHGLWRFDDAVKAYEKCLDINPDDSEALKNLGNSLYQLQENERAAEVIKKALVHEPNDADAHFNLANVLHTKGELDAAFDAFERARTLNPGENSYAVNLSLLLKDLGEVNAAIECLRVLDTQDELTREAHSNLIFCMLNLPEYNAADIRAEAGRWYEKHASPFAVDAFDHDGSRKPSGKLKIGYLSGDLRQHPVGFFMDSVFEHHDRKAFEVHVFSTFQAYDDVSARINQNVDQWHDVARLSLHELAETIHALKIDILIDLSGHAAHNRMAVLAYRPAPVQLLGGGLFCTSGLEGVDGLLTDRFQTPPGMDDFYSEPLIRLANGYVCYRPPAYAADVRPSPCLENGFITFGCFNNLSKISEPSAEVWAKILHQVPESRLLLKTTALSSARARERLSKQFAGFGIDKSRLIIEPGCGHEAFLAEYGRVDIALDPFPYCGGLTTLESLWMGVPVVTLSGDTFAARHSTSHLGNLGLDNLVCQNPDGYAETARALSEDTVALDALRQSLRSRMAASPIVDGAVYTQGLEHVYRTIWRTRWRTDSAI